MSYMHKGVAQNNGTIDFGSTLVDSSELVIQPEDDGFHIVDYNVGDFEWWYFDIVDHISGFFLKIVIHIGTDPLKTRIYPQLAVSVKTSCRNESFTKPYHINDIEVDTQQCNISIKDDIKVWTEYNSSLEYFLEIDIPQFQCNLRFISNVEGWKPLGKEIKHHIGKKKGIFSWIIPVPRAKVEGEFIYKDEKLVVHDGIGYHDHNYIKVDKKHPLHLDEFVAKWYWGKCYVDRFTLVFMDTYFRTNRTQSLLIAENNKIVYSSNNLIECSISCTGYDNSTKAEYPASFIIKSKDKDFPLRTEFELDRILDRKDLLEGINPVLKWLIKKIVARPVYNGILVKATLIIMDDCWYGFGNIESMVFRGK